MPNPNTRGSAALAVDPTPASRLCPSTAPNTRAPARVELWGGVECTVNRVRDHYLDQMERSGHAQRISDLDLFAELGIRALRYPVLWERTAPVPGHPADWSWADERLQRLRELEIRPIVGLVHHGSGPRHTSLVSQDFAEGLAEFARRVAERYPWVEDYTPVNEPLTTARFSGLYGHWYPHGRDSATFARALINQCRAVNLSMRAIRKVNPAARLVQTDDLGKTFSTPRLAYQAEFENERRWITWDLLTGRLDREHLVWDHLICSGIQEAELDWFLEHPCPPDVIGVNYYLTSERFLDERVRRYPKHTRGGNQIERYADVEAVRVCASGTADPYTILREAWERYRLPVAVTEAHLGCTREEQVRWLLDVWRGAERLRGEGADVRAVTAWSLIGAYDWNSLVTRDAGHYEPGVFDLRGGTPRPTALAGAIRELGAGREPVHPSLAVPGWWRRDARLLYPRVVPHQASSPADGDASPTTVPAVPAARPRNREEPASSARPLAITGATGTLGRAFSRLCDLRGLPHRLLSRQDVDIAVPFSVEDLLDELQPWAVVNTAGYVRVDDAETDAERCYRENTEGPAVLAAACARRGIPLLTYSSDLVFDGSRTTPYVESSPVSPLNVYGRSKADAERRVLEAHAGALVVRTSAFFGPWDEYNFVTIALRELAAGRPFVAANDAVISPTYVPDLVNASLDLLIDGEAGIWHLANEGSATWLDLARRAAAMAGVDAATLEGTSTASQALAAPRPLYSVLGSERGMLLPTLESALERFLADRVGACAVVEEDEKQGRSTCPTACSA